MYITININHINKKYLININVYFFNTYYIKYGYVLS